MLIAIAFALLAAIVLLPSFWVKQTLGRHGVERSDLPGTGAELAKHLIEHYQLTGVTVERTDEGDHYDPATKTVRLKSSHHDGRSLAAVAVAAHEVGHAIQDARDERSLRVRQSLVRFAVATDKLAGWFFIAAPVLAILARTPAAFFALVAVGVSLLGISVIVNLVTLPVEFDASFGKALPILRAGNYLKDSDLPAIRSVLRAAALTYVAAALISLVNLARWVSLLR